MIKPWWPLAGLAAIQLGDAAMCLKPAGFIRACLTDVRFPRRYWRLLPVLKTAAAVGLMAGIWIEPLAVITAAALVAYFLVAIIFHIRARDFGRNLFVNATGMLVLCILVLAVVLRSV
ncbi:DoxX family protein [Actinomadura madurae]|uniref:DoxX family protein n=1 Tax=Actinomadura madurae TaxID=1993 RepID=UPI00399ADB99